MAKKQENMEASAPRDTYQTGMTDPPKKRGGLIAGLFMVIIFLCGIITGLGAMNITLFRQLNEGNGEKAMSFSRSDGVSTASYGQERRAAEEVFADWGFAGCELSEVHRNYYGFPQGIYISQVDAASPLNQLQPGDVLFRVNETPITCLEDARTVLTGLQSGTFCIYRAGQELILIY